MSVGKSSGQGVQGVNKGAAAAAAGTRLDPWHGFYSSRAANMRASEVRQLFAVANRPEVVSLAGGMPNIEGLPLDLIADITAKMLRTEGMRALQYGNGQGEEATREAIIEVMKHDGITAHPDDVVVTTGSQQALDLVTSTFVNPGDVILAESPSYVGALGVFRSYEADVRHLPTDENGLVPEALEESIKSLRAEGKTIKYLYTIPNFHNPAGICLSAQRRPQIVDICSRHRILIVEDNPYGLLGFEGNPEAALQTLNPEGVVYLGSFSKIFAPGYRIGWALAPHAIREKLVLACESAVLCPSRMAQMSITTYLENYDWYKQVVEYRTMYRGRRDAMIAALEKYMPMTSWTVPEGGFYTWVQLPDGLNAKAMLPRAVTNLVAYTSGNAFFADNTGTEFMRLSYCYPPEERITEGVRRLSEVVKAELELATMFGTGGKA